MRHRNRTHHACIWLLVLAGLGLSAAAVGQTRSASANADLWAESSDEEVGIDLTAGYIEQLLKRIEETDPEQARSLRELRDTNPPAFSVEIRRVARRQLGAHRPQKTVPPAGRSPAEKPAASPAEKTGDAWSDTLDKRLDDFVAWMGENYPEKAQSLRQLRETDRERFLELASAARRRYEPILRAEKRNPALAAALRHDLDLQDRRDDLLRRIAQAERGGRDELTAELQTVLDRRFDVIIETKRLRFQELERKIEEMRQDVLRQQAQLTELEQTKPQVTRERLEELLRTIEPKPAASFSETTAGNDTAGVKTGSGNDDQ